MVQISCRPSDVAASSGILDWSRPWVRRVAEPRSATPESTSSAAVTARRNPSRNSHGGDHTFEKRSNVRDEPTYARKRGAATRRKADTAMSSTMWQNRMLRAIKWYQDAFQWRPSPCRFSPTCSHYSHEAISLHGPWKGLLFTIRRLLKCRPFGPSGFDPVPDVNSSTVADQKPLRTS